jgi:hypothetical protein
MLTVGSRTKITALGQISLSLFGDIDMKLLLPYHQIKAFNEAKEKNGPLAYGSHNSVKLYKTFIATKVLK